MEWQQNPKTIPLQETPLASQSPNSNESTAAEVEETRRLLIGAMLTQVSCTEQFATLLQLAVRSNSATPKTAGALSYALSAMVSLSMNMCAQLKASTAILMRWRLTTQSDLEILGAVDACEQLLKTIEEMHDL
jgi:hypothetical protein